MLAQQSTITTIKGFVKDEFANALEDINVFIEGTNKGAASNAKGYFEIKNVALKDYVLIFSGIGMEEKRVTVKPEKGKFTALTVQLKNNINAIDEVVVLAKTEAEKIEETGFAVKAIDVKELQGQSVEVSEVLKRSEGIRIRLSGGVGAKYSFSLNGLSNNRIRFFVDQIPTTYLGGIYDLNNIPVNIVNTVEVYKGVVPIFLGADALGGAVNISTFKSDKSFIDLSYSYGSFNTNRLTLNSQYRNQKTGFTIRPKLYYLSSDNNYTVYDTEVYNLETFEWEVLDVERFHDTYSSATSIVEAGYSNVKWADELLLGHSYNTINDDEQTDIFGNPRGEVRSKETSNILSLKYNKTNLINGKLDVNFFSIYNELNRKVIDTASNRYNWAGEITRVANDNTAELFSQKTLFEYEQKNFINRAYAKYNISDEQSVAINSIFNHLERQGENRLGVLEEQPFRTPNGFNSNITGLTYDSNWFDDKLNINIGGKYYNYNLSAKNAITNNDFSVDIEDIEKNLQNWGYYLSSRFFITPNFYIKVSYERATRFPDVDEIFGDGLIVYANPELLPEESNNFNLGLDHQLLLNKHCFKTKANFFYRQIDNYIDELFFIRGLIYENLSSVLIYGGEFSLNYSFKDKLNIKGNLTRVFNLNNEKFLQPSNQENLVYKDQLPNEPTLFGNIAVNGNMIKTHKMNLSANYFLNFVDEFFLSYESIATAGEKNTIPEQLVHSLGTTLKFNEDKYSLSLECNNVFNSLVFDNFNIQNPGRSFSLKFRCNVLQ